MRAITASRDASGDASTAVRRSLPSDEDSTAKSDAVLHRDTWSDSADADATHTVANTTNNDNNGRLNVIVLENLAPSSQTKVVSTALALS
jgi:hypothetical protein